jgi:hypothetical protein
MTPGEFKFALHVEIVLNKIPQPEYRQLMVEALMVLTLMAENDAGKLQFSQLIQVDKIVQTANTIYLKDQVSTKQPTPPTSKTKSVPLQTVNTIYLKVQVSTITNSQHHLPQRPGQYHYKQSTPSTSKTRSVPLQTANTIYLKDQVSTITNGQHHLPLTG